MFDDTGPYSEAQTDGALSTLKGSPGPLIINSRHKSSATIACDICAGSHLRDV